MATAWWPPTSEIVSLIVTAREEVEASQLAGRPLRPAQADDAREQDEDTVTTGYLRGQGFEPFGCERRPIAGRRPPAPDAPDRGPDDQVRFDGGVQHRSQPACVGTDCRRRHLGGEGVHGPSDIRGSGSRAPVLERRQGVDPRGVLVPSLGRGPLCRVAGEPAVHAARVTCPARGRAGSE